jgi:hypothetical protein
MRATGVRKMLEASILCRNFMRRENISSTSASPRDSEWKNDGVLSIRDLFETASGKGLLETSVQEVLHARNGTVFMN